jgi:hypothetical protein
LFLAKSDSYLAVPNPTMQIAGVVVSGLVQQIAEFSTTDDT